MSGRKPEYIERIHIDTGQTNKCDTEKQDASHIINKYLNFNHNHLPKHEQIPKMTSEFTMN